MDLTTFLMLLVGALCHATWNTLLKMRLDPLDGIVLISIGTAIYALPGLALFDLPPRETWPYIGASLAIHAAYYAALVAAYRLGDMGQIYPIARGSATFITAGMGLVVLDEHIGPLGWTGLILLTSGIAILSLAGLRSQQSFNGRAVGFALLTATMIATYTIVDGMGARLSGNALAYATALILGDGIMMGLYGVSARGKKLIADTGMLWRVLFVGGALSAVSYTIALWAMTRAPLALVSAVRETGVLFAAILSVVVLKERLLPARIVAALLVFAGLVAIRLR